MLGEWLLWGYRVTIGKVHKLTSEMLKKFYTLIQFEVPAREEGMPSSGAMLACMDLGSVRGQQAPGISGVGLASLFIVSGPVCGLGKNLASQEPPGDEVCSKVRCLLNALSSMGRVSFSMLGCWSWEDLEDG